MSRPKINKDWFLAVGMLICWVIFVPIVAVLSIAFIAAIMLAVFSPLILIAWLIIQAVT